MTSHRDFRHLRIALLTHSVNPRGGVVHCLELADALVAQGHAVTVHAPVQEGAKLFRVPHCQVRLIPDDASAGDLRTLVQRRIECFVRWFEQPGNSDFDLFHAHDGIGANALLALQQAGRIPGYVRTVHHLQDTYGDALLDAYEERSILGAGCLLSVSPTWKDKLTNRFGRQVSVVGNGVDSTRFQPDPAPSDQALKQRLGLGKGPVFLVVGGIEARKNTIAALQAFIRVRALVPDAQLLIAGGASLLDHSRYQQRFFAESAEVGLSIHQVQVSAPLPAEPADVVIAGVIGDDEMPSLYRLATALVFPSLVEGFGLAIIEAMASGIPAIVSKIAPFTDFLGPDDCLWADPSNYESLAFAMSRSLLPGIRMCLSLQGRNIARKHDWSSCAERHLAAYQTFLSSYPTINFEEYCNA